MAAAGEMQETSGARKKALAGTGNVDWQRQGEGGTLARALSFAPWTKTTGASAWFMMNSMAVGPRVS